MEDEDGESINVDSWPMSEQISLKDNSYVCETLNNKTNNLIDYVDGVEENKDEGSSEDKVFNSKIIFKGFKKRILAQTQENQLPERIINQDLSIISSPKSSRDRNIDNKCGKITEYAQYLGLQPTGKYKCPKCNPIVTFRTMAMLKQHQSICSSNSNLNYSSPSTSEQYSINNNTQTSTSSTNNFRISRKVYLCAACGTYFENWNLFLHMREIHKRHICLFCLGMFGQAERLSHHLVKKHSVPETQFHTIDDFYTVFKGSCYLICCICEKVFSETDNFYTHNCDSLNQRINTNSLCCSVCRQSDGKHLSTCKFDINYERKNSSIIDQRIQASDSEQTLFPNPANAVAKKLLGANKSRFKTNERALLSSYKRKLLNLYARNINSKSRKKYSKIIDDNCESLSINTSIDSSIVKNLTKFDNDRQQNRLINLNNSIKDREIVEIDVTKSPAHEITLDRYTDTIMQVSKCKTIKDYEEFQTNFDIDEMDEEINPNDFEDYNRLNNFDDTSDIIEKGELILDDGNDDTPIGSPSMSPNHLNFTPIQEPIIKKLDQLNSPRINLNDSIECNNTPEESPSLTVSRVNSTNRSLVIKICTNKNSQFSITTPNVNGNYSNNDEDEENEDEDDEEEEEDDVESEENNKSVNSDKELSINDQQSDSENENSNTKLPEEELNNINNIEPPPSPATTTTTTAPVINTNENEEGIKDQEIPTDLSPELTTINESLSINDKKIDETSQTKETTFDINPTTSESIKLNTENESLNICKLNDEKIDEIKELTDENNCKNDKQLLISDEITLAADETPSIDINVDGTLDSIEIDDLLKRCIEAASPTCIYCNHARHIAVNGKQLALHMLAEHKFQPQHPAIIIHHDQFNTRVKKSLDELTSRWFNLDSYDNTRGTYNVSTVKIYECYLCHIYYSVHKELCLHNRKMHQKTILICIMCKSTFYSHSELVCHLCPGIYSSHINIRYRCCLCDIESLPSAFRLMVHLRKRHHACDVCLESTGNQQRLSNHVWKHKLHHLCYRCGIAYRNKPDITKHLFWKHGTESVLCKKCLQKKWPHIYHFCIPPSAFVCEECGATFSRAVALKVHKRIHTGDEPHECLECSARFISKKLLVKHGDMHKPLTLKIQSAPPLLQINDEQNQINVDVDVHTDVINNDEVRDESISEIKNITTNIQKENVKKVLDVYDLPPLNLSSDSDTDVEDDKLSLKKENEVDKSQNIEGVQENNNIDVEIGNLIDNETNKSTIVENFEVKLDNIVDNILSTETNDSIRDVDESNEDEIKKEEVVIMNGIWDNFKSYTASLEVKEQTNIIDNELPKNQELLDVIAAEHDYCTVYDDNSKNEHEIISNNDINNDDVKAESTPSIDEINISANSDNTNDMTKRKTNKSPKKKTKQSQDDGSSSSSDSSSDSDSSSCSCGTNCSCSSSSSGSSSSSSSSSDSDSSTSESSPKKSSVVKKDRRKDKDTKKNRSKDLSESTQQIDVEIQIETKNNIQTVDNGVEETADNTNTNEQTVDNIILPSAPSPLRESDLETDETETDEDFYDEYPQQHANNLLAEKRNQLMLLATVAPQSADDSALGSSSNDMKNGIVDNSIAMTNLSSQKLSMTQTSTNTKRKIKTKRRKKGEGGRGRGKRQQNLLQSTPTIVNPLPIIESIKLNIPKILYRNKKPGVRRNSSSPNVNTVKTREPKLPAVTYQISQTDYNINQLGQLKTPNAHNISNDNESANENKRSSKRKRVPKKFYGDSSDEDQQRLPNSMNQKWRRIDTQIPTNSYVPSITIKQNYGPLSSTFQSTTNYQTVPSTPTIITEPESEPETVSVPISTPAPEPTPVSSVVDSDDPATAAAAAADDDDDDDDGSSSDSSTSEIEQPRHHPPRQHPGDNNSQGTMLPNRQTNLYCYCQCPYDEVSEMIACDGDSCRIEWFHFECVGIMVPPKGKWYCPDCSKRDPTLPSNEYFV